MGSLAAGIGLFILSQSYGLISWYLGWAILGVGMACSMFNVVFSVLAQVLQTDAKSAILKVTLISGFATLFYPITTYFVESIGWRHTLLLYGIPFVAVLAPLYYRWISPVAHPARIPVAPRADLREAYLVFGALAAFAILRTLIGTSVSVHILEVFKDFRLSPETGALVAAFIGPSQSLGRLLELMVGRKLSASASAIFWSSLLPVALFALVVFGAPAAVPFAIAYGMSNGMASISISLLLMAYFKLSDYPSLAAKIAAPTMVIQALAPLLTSSLLGKLQVPTILFWAGGLSVIATLCLVVIMHSGRARE